MFDAELRIPERGLVLHIGPHKTGTTAIQGALNQARAQMKECGVVYPGPDRQHQMAALAITGGRGLDGDRSARTADWRRLVRQVNAASDQRVIVSSEFFDDASDDSAHQVIADLGGERVHVVVTLRPLAKILPSAWQQYVRNRLRMSYDDWLDSMFNRPPYTKPTKTFWPRHRHGLLVERWASIVGPEHLLVVVVDESDRESLMRTFERIVELPSGLLTQETFTPNRSLTAGETELVRALNIEFKQCGWPLEVYHRAVRHGVVMAMQAREPGPDEIAIPTPAWAIERANEVAAEEAARITATGVHVLGDLALLSAVRPKPIDGSLPSLDQVQVPVVGARDAIIGVIRSGVAGEIPLVTIAEPEAPSPVAAPTPPSTPEPIDAMRVVEGVRTRELAKVVAKRVRNRVKNR